jgi:hypothetical protein
MFMLLRSPSSPSLSVDRGKNTQYLHIPPFCTICHVPCQCSFHHFVPSNSTQIPSTCLPHFLWSPPGVSLLVMDSPPSFPPKKRFLKRGKTSFPPRGRNLFPSHEKTTNFPQIQTNSSIDSLPARILSLVLDCPGQQIGGQMPP